MSLGRSWLAAALALAPCAAAAQPPPMSTDALIARHVAARGGLQALQAVHTLDMAGSLRPAGFNADLGYREVMSRPGSVRIEVTLQGLTSIQAYNGAAGWQVQPFQGRKDAEALSADDVKPLQEEADFEGALVNAAAKGSTVDNLGQIDLDGGPTYALRVNLKNGDQQTYYIDPDAFLTVRLVTRQVVRGAETLTQTDFSDYEKVDGVYFPFEVDSGPKGSPDQQRITYKTVLANERISPAAYDEPKGTAGTPIQQLITPSRPEDQPPPPGVPKPNTPKAAAPSSAPNVIPHA